MGAKTSTPAKAHLGLIPNLHTKFQILGPIKWRENFWCYDGNAMRLKSRDSQKAHLEPLPTKSTYQISTCQLILEGSYAKKKNSKHKKTLPKNQIFKLCRGESVWKVETTKKHISSPYEIYVLNFHYLAQFRAEIREERLFSRSKRRETLVSPFLIDRES